MMKTNIRVLLTAATALTVSTAFAYDNDWLPTNYGGGADAEVRESNPTQNRGDSTEIASRVRNDANPLVDPSADGSDRNSSIYLKFDVSQFTGVSVTASDFAESALRLTYRNNNLRGSRIQDTVTPNPGTRTGLAIYGLDPNAAGADWAEDAITYNTAPGIMPDLDVGTKDFTSDLTLLGTVLFPNIGNQNWLPVGGQLVFEGAGLSQFVADTIMGGASSITLVATTLHGGDAPFRDWINFNYLFNPKEQTTLNNDPNYDVDVTDPNNLTGDYTSKDNSNGAFSPSLYLPVVPEPTSMALMGIGAAALLIFRRRA
jgi:hypothetical protein